MAGLYSIFLYETVEKYWGSEWLKLHRLNTIMRTNYCFFDQPYWLYHLALIKAFCPDLSLSEAVRLAHCATN